jgi:hypothetical protein
MFAVTDWNEGEIPVVAADYEPALVSLVLLLALVGLLAYLFRRQEGELQ